MKRIGLVIGLAFSLSACSGGEGGTGGTGGGDTGSIKGTVKDSTGNAIAAATVKAGAKSANTTATGAYTLSEVPVGNTTVDAKANWYEPKSDTVDVAKGAEATLDFALAVRALEAKAADLTAAATYQGSFDWKTDKVSVVVVENPTKAELDEALYYQNPALYRPVPTGQATITPATQPTMASGLDFPISATGKAYDGEQALQDFSDNLAGTSLNTAEQAQKMMWIPAIDTFLGDWNFDKIEPLVAAIQAVKAQNWGGTTSGLPAQTIEHVYLSASGDLWVEVVFQPFVTLTNITDSDSDGFKEVYAKVNPTLVDAAAVTELRSQYLVPEHGTLALAAHLDHAINSLYSSTSAVLGSALGEPITLPGGASISHPFAVIEHSGSIKNVVIVKP